MKRMLICLAIALLLSLTLYAAIAEPLGWGIVNATDVALRRGAGGKVIVRLPEDTCVWINDSHTDSRGVLWYEIHAGLHVDNANYDFSGWMMAVFIDAGDALWHDVTGIAAGDHGLIALRADGSTLTAGRPIVSMDGSRWVSPAGWADAYRPVTRVGVPQTGNGYFVVTADGAFISSVNGVPSAEGHAQADLLEAAEPIIASEPFPTWHDDTETVVFRSASLPNPANPTLGLPIPVYIGVRADGSVIAEPASVAAQLSGWSDMADIRVTSRLVMGLKQDGTVVFAAIGDGVSFDVSHWKDIVAIGLGRDWCVGLRRDGTLVFAGDHVLMNEGHSRK